MEYGFVEFAKNISWYAAIDIALIVLVTTLLCVFFAYKRNFKVLLILVCVCVLDVLVNVLSELNGYAILAPARYILHFMMIFSVVTPIVVYQSDFKNIFQKIANPKTYGAGEAATSDDELRDATTEILIACQNMAKQDIGAIIIIDQQGDIHDNILETGTRLGATLSSPLLEAIFNTHAPLHDGAVVVRGNKIVAAGCFLTLTQRPVNKELGTRHRAAIGVTEETNVLSIVVSEETGIISVVKHGEIKRYMTMDKLKDEIEEAYNISATALAKKQQQKDKKYLRRFQ